MVLDVGTASLLLLLGGFVAVDGTSYGQFMISRPLVAACLAGWIVGAPAQGAMIGIVLEALHLPVLPVGAAKYPEGGPPAVAAGAIYALIEPSSVAILTLTVLALGLEWLGGETVRLVRTANVKIVNADSGIVAIERLERRHLAAIAMDFIRGVTLVAIGGLILAAAVRYVVPLVRLDERIATIAILGALVAMLTSVFRMQGARVAAAVVGAAVGIGMLALS
jgi:mannose/fructose/N-acetylgalactosamine-specific phosphotransferase system component IIC